MNAVTRICALLTAVCLLTLTIFAAVPEDPAPVTDSRGAVPLQMYAKNIPLKDLKIAGTVLCCVAEAGYTNEKDYRDTMVEVRDKITTSDADVLEVRYHETDPRYFYITPMSFGQADLFFQDGALSVQQTVSVEPRTLNFYAGDHRLITSTPSRPFPLLLTWVGISPYFDRPTDLPLPLVSSDESVVKVEKTKDFTTRGITPKKPGRAVLTYSDGCYQADLFVEVVDEKFARPDTPGFHVFIGSYEKYRDRLTLEQGDRALLSVYYYMQESLLARLRMEEAELSVSQPGIVVVEPENILYDSFEYQKFYVYGVEPGETTITCSVGDQTYSLPITVTEPGTDAVPPLPPRTSGFYAWDGPLQIRQDSLTVPQEGLLNLSVIQILQRGDVSYAKHADLLWENFSFNPSGIAFAQPYQVHSGNYLDFYLHGQKPGKTTMTCTLDGQAYSIPVTVTEPEETPPLTPGETVEIKEPTVEAINKALASHPGGTTFLLPSGNIPWSTDSAIIVEKNNVTLRGQDTLLESDMFVRGTGVRLEDLAFHVSYYDSDNQYVRDYSIITNTVAMSTPIALWGDGAVTMKNCVIRANNNNHDSGTGVNLQGSRIKFEGKNVFDGCHVGLIIEARAGRTRPHASGLEFKNCDTALRVASNISETRDPYFYRFTECNFLNNRVNVQNQRRPDMAANFNVSNNYFQGGTMIGEITDYPRYQDALGIGTDGTVSGYPPLILPPGAGEIPILNGETPAPIAAGSFSGLNTPLTLSVRQLNGDKVLGAEDTRNLLEWSFEKLESEGDWPDFQPSAYIDETFPPQWTGGVDRYQGIHFFHDGNVPLEGARVKVKKQVELNGPLYLYEVSKQGPAYAGTVSVEGDTYCFDMGHCSDYMVTNVKIEESGGGDSGGSNGSSSGGGGSSGGDSGSGSSPALTPPSAPPGPASHTQEAYLEQSAERQEASGETARSTPANSEIPGQGRESNSPGAIGAGSFWSMREVLERFESAGDSQVSFDVAAKPVVSGQLFEALGQSPEKTVILLGDGYRWTFHGRDAVNGVNIPDSFNTSVSTVSPNLSSLKRAAGDRPFQCVYFSHHGPLPFRAEIVVAVEGQGPYDVAYFNPDTQALEPVSQQVPVKDGCVSWELSHCSDYVLFPLSAAAQPAAVTAEPPAPEQPDPGRPRKYWGAAGIAVLLCGAGLFFCRQRKRTTA